VVAAGSQPQGAPLDPASNTYIAVDDADATAEAITNASGTTLAARLDVLDAGRDPTLADPFGAVFSV
jgi:predicted enzyme related to lactoylglutathione lyase